MTEQISPSDSAHQIVVITPRKEVLNIGEGIHGWGFKIKKKKRERERTFRKT